jgi:hypothetical protein
MAAKRSKGSVVTERLNFEGEFEGVFGDLRLTRRAGKVTAAWVEGGATSFPNMLGPAGVEGLYRLVNNDRFEFTEAVAGLSARTTERAAATSGLIVVPHDTTDFSVPLHDPNDVREHFAIKTSRTQGFELHVSMALSFDQQNTPLGVLDCRPFVHHKHLEEGERGDKARSYWYQMDGLYPNEQQRWQDSIAYCADELGDKAADAIHVMDREADSFELLVWMQARGHRFVQRANLGRRFVGPDYVAISEALNGTPVLAKATVTLGARTPARSSKEKKAHPDRKARHAELSIRAGQVEVMAPRSNDASRRLSGSEDHLPASQKLWLVDVREEHPPGGEAPVRWLLLTNEPAHDAATALLVVDLYRSRWGIEVYFRVLKTGLGLEQRQAESADAMLRVVALALPVATEVLRLRHMADIAPKALWSRALTATQFEVLRRKSPNAKLTEQSTVEQVVMAIATLGGFLKSNKVPGWQTIYQGWAKLEAIVEGYELASVLRCDR